MVRALRILTIMAIAALIGYAMVLILWANGVVYPTGMWGGFAGEFSGNTLLKPGSPDVVEIVRFVIVLIVLPLVIFFCLLLNALRNCNRVIYRICLTLILFYSVAEIAKTHVPFFAATVAILLLTNPVRRYFFKKPIFSRKGWFLKRANSF